MLSGWLLPGCLAPPRPCCAIVQSKKQKWEKVPPATLGAGLQSSRVCPKAEHIFYRSAFSYGCVDSRPGGGQAVGSTPPPTASSQGLRLHRPRLPLVLNPNSKATLNNSSRSSQVCLQMDAERVHRTGGLGGEVQQPSRSAP